MTDDENEEDQIIIPSSSSGWSIFDLLILLWQ